MSQRIIDAYHKLLRDYETTEMSKENAFDARIKRIINEAVGKDLSALREQAAANDEAQSRYMIDQFQRLEGVLDSMVAATNQIAKEQENIKAKTEESRTPNITISAIVASLNNMSKGHPFIAAVLIILLVETAILAVFVGVLGKVAGWW